MENKDWREEFEEVFYAIMGLETDPEGVPNMYLIRDENDNVLNGIDFTPEKEAIKSFIESLLKSKQEEIEGACCINCKEMLSLKNVYK